MAHKKMGMTARVCLFLLSIIFITLPALAPAREKPLPAKEAFRVSVVVDHAKQVTVHWQIAQDYYLYRKHMQYDFSPPVNADIRWPQGEIHQDLTRGEYQVYSGNVSIPITFSNFTQKMDLKISYQGCSSKGFCYPPMHKTISLNMGTPPITHNFQSLITDQNRIFHLFDSQSTLFLLLIFSGIGLLLALTPCVLPMIPILMSIVAGQKQSLNTRKAFSLAVVYVLGSALTYAGAGLLTAWLGASLQAHLQQPWVIALTSSVFVLLSLSLFGLLELRIPATLQNRITALSRKQTGGTYAGVFIMGMVSTLIVSPCVTAPLVGVLAYIAQTGNLLLGASALFVMGIGMGIPLIVMAVSAGKWLPRRGRWMMVVQYLFGLIMLGLAFWLLSRVFAIHTFMIFAGVLLITLTLFLRQHLWFNRRIGLACACCGLLLIAAVNVSSLKTHLPSIKSSNAAMIHSFTIVKNLDDLNQQLLKARASGKPVMLDFYADWCESCISMDKKVFSQPNIMNSLMPFVLLRADLTENNSADEMMLKNYDVIAPPTVIFFNAKGDEIQSQRIVGEVSATEFKQRLQNFRSQM